MRALISLTFLVGATVVSGAASFNCGSAAKSGCLVFCDVGKSYVRLLTSIDDVEEGSEFLHDLAGDQKPFINKICDKFCGGTTITGLVVEPHKMYSQEVPVAFKVTMASLGPDAKDSVAVQESATVAVNGAGKALSNRNTLMLVHQKDGEFALCTLIPTIHEQQPLDIVFTEGEMIHLRVQGESPVHLTGYYLEDQTQVDSEDEYDSEMGEVEDLDHESACEGCSEEDEDEDEDEYETEESEEEENRSSKKRHARRLVESDASEEESVDESEDGDDDDEELDSEDYDSEDDEDFIDDSEDEDEYDSDDSEDDDDEELDDSDDEDEEEDEEETIRQELKSKRPANQVAPANAQKKNKTETKVVAPATKSSDKKETSDAKASVQNKEAPSKANKPPVASIKKETPATEKASDKSLTSTPKADKVSEKSNNATPKAEKTTEKPSTASKENKQVANSAPTSTNSTPSKPTEQPSSKSPALISKTLPNGIQYEDVKAGNGIKANKGRRVGIEYEIFGEDGKMLDSNKGKELLYFSHMDGGHEVHRGIHIGITGMALGGERKITIPAKFTDESQQPSALPKGKTVTVQVKLVKVASGKDNKN